MNRIIAVICIIAAVFLFNVGLAIRAKVNELSRQNKDLLMQNNHMGAEIYKKHQLAQTPPVALTEAFSLVINEIRYLESASGTTMNLTIEKSQDNEDIADHYVDSQYRGIKKLPVIVQVDKFSNETDMGAVLNDLYQLETVSDFKVNEIIKDGNGLMVKGDVYGF